MVNWHEFRVSFGMKNLLSSILILFSVSSFAQNLTQQVDEFLKTHVRNGLVDYKTIKENPSKLNAILNQFNRAPVLEGDNEKAFLINAYNLFVIKGIVDHYPVEGPLKIGGFFDEKMFRLRGKGITLNTLEKEMLYKQFPDPRLHFALVCAAVDCPELAAMAYDGSKLESQLARKTRSVINNQNFIRLNGPNAEVSQIFEWYADDFGGKEQVIPFIQQYLLKKVKLNPGYSFYEYDWSLNEQK